MKRTLHALALTTIAISSLAANPDFIKKAIEKGHLDVIKALKKTGYTVRPVDKQTYIELAQKMVDTKKVEAKAGSRKPYVTVDNLITALSVISLVGMVKKTYDKWDTRTGKESYMVWKYPAFALVATRCAHKFLRMYKSANQRRSKSSCCSSQCRKSCKSSERVNDL